MIKARGVGEQYADKYESDISSVFYSKNGLTITVETMDKSGRKIELTILFEAVNGYQYLDEGDLAYYWASGQFEASFHVFEIAEGGWLNGKHINTGVLAVSRATEIREWFIATNNGCLTVLSYFEPIVRDD